VDAYSGCIDCNITSTANAVEEAAQPTHRFFPALDFVDTTFLSRECGKGANGRENGEQSSKEGKASSRQRPSPANDKSREGGVEL
jgi:hypothetical protein